MNDKNLKSLKDRSDQERKEIAKKGGKASALKKKEQKENIKKYKDLLSMLKGSYIVPDQVSQGVLAGYKTEGDFEVRINTLDYLLSQPFEILYSRDKELQGERIKAGRFLYQIQEDEKRAQERKEERQIRNALALKELEIKERELDLEERRIKIREELIRMKNRRAIEITDINSLKEDPKLLEEYIKRDNDLNRLLSRELEETEIKTSKNDKK